MSDPNPTPGQDRPDPLSVLWRVFAAPQTLMVLLGLVALALLLGTLVPQIPPEARGDSEAWIAAQASTFGSPAGLIQALRLYDLAHAFWFQLILVLVALCLLVRTVESAELAWRAMARNRWAHDSLALWGRHPSQAHLTSPLPPEQVWTRLDGALFAVGYHLDDVSGVAVATRVVSRRALMLWACPLACGGLLAALAGLAILVTWGWQSAVWQGIPGEVWAARPASPGAESSLQVRLDGFDLVLEDGRLRDYRSEITWLEGNVVLKQQSARVGQPSTAQGISLRQMGYLPTVRLRGRDERGDPLVLQTADQQPGGLEGVEIAFPAAEAQPAVLIPSHDLVLALSFEPLCAEGGPVVHTALLRGGSAEPESLRSLHEDGSLEFDGLQVDLEILYRPLLRLNHTPGTSLIFGGLLLALVGLVAGWLAPPGLAWIAVGPDRERRSRIRAVAPSGARASCWWLALESRLQEALADGD